MFFQNFFDTSQVYLKNYTVVLNYAQIMNICGLFFLTFPKCRFSRIGRYIYIYIYTTAKKFGDYLAIMGDAKIASVGSSLESPHRLTSTFLTIF